jgi:hypothetical protein
MRLLPMLLSLAYPACGSEGAAGLAVPAPMEMSRIERPASPNTALAAPAGFAPTPDIVTAVSGDPEAVYAAVRRFAAGQDHLFLHAAYDDRRQVHFVARTPTANFPDLVTAQVTQEGGLILWSRSVYGRSDFGVNRARLDAWVAAIGRELSRN